jgi:hypothetical protein
MKIRKFLDHLAVIHFEVFLGLFALLGYLKGKGDILLFFVALSFSGALCGAFGRVIDAIRENKK